MKLQPLQKTSPGLKPVRSRKKLLWWILAAAVSVIISVGVACLLWYQAQLQPVDSSNDHYVVVVVESGMTPDAIGDLLEEKKVIKNNVAFDIYTRLTSSRHRLQAGTYRLSPAQSTPQIVDHLTSGRVQQMTVTFYPGATLVDNTDKAEDKKTDVTTVLQRLGYADEEIKAALAKQYDHPIFKDKPASADLEGYIYGETYQFDSGASVESILTRVFDHFYEVIKDENLEEGFAKQGLNLYQGITLASIIQKEAIGGDEAQIAQVFLSRYSIDMPLGSDVTYQYIADKTGAERHPNLDSPYNTRKYKGLPPGPIAAPGLAALKAVANPAPGDYLYFLSGDDNITYFAKTFSEHEKNIRDHCQEKCQIL